MRILKLATTGVRGLRDAAWALEPDRGGDGHAVVVTGPPRAGLTTFLDSIAFTALRLSVGGTIPLAGDVLRAGGTGAIIRSTWWLEADERTYGGVTEETTSAEVVFELGGLGRVAADPALLGLMSRYDHSATLSKIVSIPARRVTNGAAPSFSDFEADQRFSRLSFDPAKFDGVPQALARLATGYGDPARFAEVRRLFGELAYPVQLAGVGASGMLEFSLPSGLTVPLKHLGFSERNALVLAAVPVLLGLQRSVILLDTPELGLAPGVAARWLGALRGATPDAQWIVASRDPDVVASVAPAARIELPGAT